MMEMFSPQYMLSILQIIWIDLLLSGDNAVVIALACRSLPERQRKLGMILGAGAAVGLRIVFALAITYLLGVPFLKVAGGLLLLWIAVKLARGEDEDQHEIADSDSLWKAVRTIAIADAVMSLDNVVAIAAAARGHVELFIFGLLLSIPLIVVGSALIMNIIQRFPIFVWAGAALLGFIAGEMLVSDPVVLSAMQTHVPAWLRMVPVEQSPSGTLPIASIYYGAAVVGALFVILLAMALKRRAHEPVIEEQPVNPEK